jgi:asparagine synthase (glutamine-hydrolysing)
MCGIAGIIKLKKNHNCDKDKIFSLMHNRGPDGKGAYKNLNQDYSINLFHSRLAIIDNNERSNQPFFFENLILIYNGEIYNFKDIKKKLIEHNYRFKTTSDTEVLIKAYHKWGENCFKLFDGMWSVCIYDLKKHEMILSRDIFGEKPLYIYKNHNTLVFGSELKFLLSLEEGSSIKRVNKNHLNQYLKHGYKYLFKKNETYFENILKIEPGTINKFSLINLNLKKKTQILKKEFNKKIKISREEAVEQIRDIVIRSMKSRLISDRPVGFYLSGGVDTGSLTSISSKILNKKIKCFSIIDADTRYNEEKNIDITTNDLNCETIKIKFPNKEDFFERLTDLIDYHDKPISSLNYYTHSFMHNIIKKNDIKVIISGLGGDEMFTGYYDHFLMHLRELNKSDYKINLKSWKQHIKPLILNKNLRNLDLFKNKKKREYLVTDFDKKFINKMFTNKSIEPFHEKKYSNSLLKNRMLNELFHELVPLICNEDDMNSMKMSIENRSPLLNKELLNFSLSLPQNMYIKDGYGKSLFRDSMKGILNDKVRLDRKKHGFNSSIHSLINLKSKKVMDFFSKNEQLNEFINVKNFCSYLKNQKSTDNANSKFVFSVFNTAIFLKKFN